MGCWKYTTEFAMITGKNSCGTVEIRKIYFLLIWLFYINVDNMLYQTELSMVSWYNYVLLPPSSKLQYCNGFFIHHLSSYMYSVAVLIGMMEFSGWPSIVYHLGRWYLVQLILGMVCRAKHKNHKTQGNLNWLFVYFYDILP